MIIRTTHCIRLGTAIRYLSLEITRLLLASVPAKLLKELAGTLGLKSKTASLTVESGRVLKAKMNRLRLLRHIGLANLGQPKAGGQREV